MMAREIDAKDERIKELEKELAQATGERDRADELNCEQAVLIVEMRKVVVAARAWYHGPAGEGFEIPLCEAVDAYEKAVGLTKVVG